MLHTSSGQGRSRGGEFRGGALALHQDQFAADLGQGSAPAEQGVKGGHGAGGDIARLEAAVEFLGPAPADLGVVETEGGDRGREPVRAAQHRLDQGHAQIRTGNGQSKPGQPRARADVDDGGSGCRHRLGDDRAVQHMALPQPRDLPRADQPVGDPGVGENRDELLGPGEVRAEDETCEVGSRRRGNWLLHAAYPPPGLERQTCAPGPPACGHGARRSAAGGCLNKVGGSAGRGFGWRGQAPAGWTTT